jgi:putative endonuclease
VDYSAGTPYSVSDGKVAEELAAKFLKKQGAVLVDQNYRCRYGEIDLIVKEKEVLVFVEVRLRRNEDFGGASSSITKNKQQRLLAAARHYLNEFKKIPECRFDAVLLKDLSGEKIEWLKNIIEE